MRRAAFLTIAFMSTLAAHSAFAETPGINASSAGSVIGDDVLYSVGGGNAVTTHAHRNASAFQNVRPDASTERCEIARDPGEVCKRLIDAVDLGGWHHRLDDRHDTLAHVAIYVEWKINLTQSVT